MSNDNPFSEAHFKTLKCCPAFPGRFGRLADARAFCETFFAYYNHEHRHSGIGLHTPASVHFGTASQIRQQHQATLHAAYDAHPERFGHRRPERAELGVHAADRPPAPPVASPIVPAQTASARLRHATNDQPQRWIRAKTLAADPERVAIGMVSAVVVPVQHVRDGVDHNLRFFG